MTTDCTNPNGHNFQVTGSNGNYTGFKCTYCNASQSVYNPSPVLRLKLKKPDQN